MEADAAKHRSGEVDGRNNKIDVNILNKKTILTRSKTLLIYANK